MSVANIRKNFTDLHYFRPVKREVKVNRRRFVNESPSLKPTDIVPTFSNLSKAREQIRD
jgi:hypothetical protein